MDFEKIYNECNKFSEETLAKGEYGIEIFTNGKWETIKQTENGAYNFYTGSPVACIGKENALNLINDLKQLPRFKGNKMRLYKNKVKKS